MLLIKKEGTEFKTISFTLLIINLRVGSYFLSTRLIIVSVFDLLIYI